MISDLPLALQERVVCSVSSAAKYEIPANVMLAVAEKENGKPGLWVRNDDGSHDVGAMQFNTAYLVTLRRYGITPADVAGEGCYPYDLAAWRLRQHLSKDAGDLWTRAANYHSRTPRFNKVYRLDLISRAAVWADWLDARYATHEFKQAGMQAPLSSPSAGRVVAPHGDSPQKLKTLPRPAAYVSRALLRTEHY